MRLGELSEVDERETKRLTERMREDGERAERAAAADRIREVGFEELKGFERDGKRDSAARSS